ncbi:MAG: N-formylglutamate amidohydrolase [Desulfuromonadaceae bacterium GWC2_58_13]|nr:MAG: N-formylglutamate amidohydrolase [Desulfuromonadaceae bacterium GWC2_58_13]
MADHPPLLFSCEHGGNRVPEPYRPLFAGHADLLHTHRGYDLGILPLARQLAREFDAPLESAEVTRLLVDLNRSVGHPTLFSFITRDLPAAEKESILRRYYRPHRQAVEKQAVRLIASGRPVIHIAIHSFTPELHGQVRNADIGLLYDPARPQEKAFCMAWQRALVKTEPRLGVRRNYPYRGAADSLGTALRRRFDAGTYLAIELEINQRLPCEHGDRWQRIKAALSESLGQALRKLTS